MSLLGLTNTTITVQRPTVTADASGGRSTTWAAVYTDLPASVQPLSGREAERFSKREMQVDFVAYTPSAIDLKVGDRVVHDSDNYLVQHWQDQAGRGRVYAVYLKRVDQ